MRAVGSARTGGSLLCASLATLCTSVRCLSLSELAKAFTEMSESNPEMNPKDNRTSEGAQRHVTADGRDAFLKNDVSVLNTTSDGKDSKEKKRSAFGNRKNDGGGVVTFSAVYGKSLGELSGPQFALLLERECKQQHYGHMMQCLVEVWRRLRQASPMEVVISDEEARGEWENGAVTSPMFRSDSLLEHVLRALAKTNIDKVRQCSNLAEGLPGGGAQSVWLTELSSLLLQWLTARAASMSASRSATLLHFIGQQKMFHCDAVLETLRDNIEVHLATTRDANLFDLRNFAMALDAIARWQMEFVRLIATEKGTRRGGPYVLKNTTATLATHQHPILNASFYNVVVSGLLRGIRDGSLHLTRHGSPSTFFFLTLALAKIRWFHTDCAKVLLPQLHDALRVFPGQFLAILLLLGRREVKVCRYETTDLMLQTLIDAMQKRGQRYAGVDERRPHRPDSVGSAASSTPVDYSSFVASGSGSKGNVLAAAMPVDMDGDDDDLRLFSTSSWCSANDWNVLSAAGNGAREISGGSQSSTVMFTTSFLDLRSIPIFLESLNHMMTITLEYCGVQNQVTQRDALSAKAGTLYEALLSDTQSGVKSLEALLERPALVERLLFSVLRIPGGSPHPFTVELAYVFTRHVSGRCVAKCDSSSGAATLRWKGRVVGLVDLLVRRGVVAAESYIMTDDVIQLAPRVLAAVEGEKNRLLERHMERQRKEHGQNAKPKKSIRTAAVFAGFSRIVVQLKA